MKSVGYKELVEIIDKQKCCYFGLDQL